MVRKWRIHLIAFFILFAFGSVLVLISPALAQCPSNIVSFWTLDETVSGTYTDSIGSNDGLAGPHPPTPTANGKVNGAQQFEAASTTRVSIADDHNDFDWAIDQSFSIEFWMKGVPGTTGAGANNEVMVGRRDEVTDLGWWVGVETGTKNFEWYITDSNGTGDAADLKSSTVDAADGEWHHIVVVRDATTNNLYLYVDGDQAAIDESHVFSDGFASTGGIALGWHNLAPYYYYTGTLDEIAIYDSALTAAEVMAHYTAQAGARYCLDTDSDGISDGEENAGPNNGDGNSDGILDMNQNTVASLLDHSGANYVTIETSAGTLASCQAVDNPSAANSPAEAYFPWGFFQFTINGLSSGAPATVTMRTPAGTAPATYYKYGPPLPGETSSWYKFNNDGQTGASYNNNIVTLSFVDGLRGDDTDADGSIVDQGGPAQYYASGGSGGGCFIAAAAHGSYMEPYLKIFRSFRNKYLLASNIGRLFVDGYYKYSPPVANFISKHETLKAATRTVLLPLVGMGYVLMHFGPVATMALLLLVMALCTFLGFIYKRKASAKKPSA